MAKMNWDRVAREEKYKRGIRNLEYFLEQIAKDLETGPESPIRRDIDFRSVVSSPKPREGRSSKKTRVLRLDFRLKRPKKLERLGLRDWRSVGGFLANRVGNITRQGYVILADIDRQRLLAIGSDQSGFVLVCQEENARRNRMYDRTGFKTFEGRDGKRYRVRWWPKEDKRALIRTVVWVCRDIWRSASPSRLSIATKNRSH